MDITSKTHKEIGTLGETLSVEYLKRHGFTILDRNVSRKIGEIDIVARKGEVLHIVEVKTVVVDAFPTENDSGDSYDPSINLHAAKIQTVARMGEWYALEQNWEGEWQVDACLVWIRRTDGMSKVQYLPQIV